MISAWQLKAQLGAFIMDSLSLDVQTGEFMVLLGAGTAGFDRVPGRGAQVELMRLVWRGRDALVKALLSDQPPALLAAESEPLIALAMALLRTGERGAADLLAAAFAPAVSLRVRRGFEQAVCRMEEPPALRAGDWLRLGGDALLQELRLRSLQCAAQALRAEDGAVLDQLLARLAAAPRPGSEAGM